MSTRKLIIVLVILFASIVGVVAACAAALSTSASRPASEVVESPQGVGLGGPQEASERLRQLAVQVRGVQE